MISYRNSYPPDCYNKVWNPVFSKNRTFLEDDCPYGELERRASGAKGDNVAIFFQNLQDSVPCCEIEEVVEFCGSIRLDDVKSGAGAAGKRHAAWLDDRRYDGKCCENECCSEMSSGEKFRTHKNPYTATEFHQRLEVKV
jgi:hypothetical protein